MLSGDYRSGSAGLPGRRLIFADRLGVNCQAQNLRKMFLHAALERGGDVMNLRNRLVAIHRTVAGHDYLVLHHPNMNIVAIHHLREVGAQRNHIALHRKRKSL